MVRLDSHRMLAQGHAAAAAGLVAVRLEQIAQVVVFDIQDLVERGDG
jgi:hypothetical protein